MGVAATRVSKVLFDAEALDAIKRCGGEELSERMIRLFLELTPQRIEALRAGLAANSQADIERVAHSLVSGCAMLGARSMEAQARKMELTAKSGAVTDGDILAFEDAYRVFQRIIETHLPKTA